MTVVAALLAGVAVEIWRPSPKRLIATRFGTPARAWRPRSIRPVVLLVPAAVVVAVVFSGPAVLVGFAVVGAVVAVAEVVRAGRSRARAMDRRRALVDALSFLVSELRAGGVPEVALASVAAESPALAPAARAAARGVDVLPVLREAAREPGSEALGLLGAAWHIAERSGAPIADAVARIVDRVRDDLDLDREVEAELSPARATARVMALLPVVGLVLGSGIGGDPVGVVLTTWIGAGCASVGIAVAVVGLTWIERIAGSVPR